MRRLALVCVACGCIPAGPDPAVDYHGEHITLHADPSIPVCASSLRYADAFLETTAAYLHVAVPDVDYNLYAHSGSCGWHAPQATMDCTHEHTVYANAWIHFHELVHTVAWNLGMPPPLLTEGLAEALGTNRTIAAHPLADIQDILDPEAFFTGDIAHHYEVAADLTAYLLGRFGASRYVRLYGSIPEYADPLSIELAFHDALGETLDDVVADWAKLPFMPEPPGMPLADTPCGVPAATPAGATWSGTTDACGVGPPTVVLDEPDVETLDIDGGLYVAAMPGGALGSLRMDTCPASSDGLEVYASGQPVQWFTAAHLVAGRYQLVLDAEGTTAETWRVSRLGAASATCDGAPVFAAPRSWTFAIEDSPSLWPVDATGQATTWVRIEPAAASSLAVTYSTSTITGQLCNGTCAAPTNCAPLDPATGAPSMFDWMPIAGDPIYLELTGPATGAVTFSARSDPQNATPSRGPTTSTRSDVP